MKKQNWLLGMCFLLGAGVLAVDNFICELPEWLLMVALGIAVLLLLAYMSSGRQGGKR